MRSTHGTSIANDNGHCDAYDLIRQSAAGRSGGQQQCQPSTLTETRNASEEEYGLVPIALDEDDECSQPSSNGSFARQIQEARRHRQRQNLVGPPTRTLADRTGPTVSHRATESVSKVQAWLRTTQDTATTSVSSVTDVSDGKLGRQTAMLPSDADIARALGLSVPLQRQSGDSKQSKRQGGIFQGKKA